MYIDHESDPIKNSYQLRLQDWIRRKNCEQLKKYSESM